MAAVRGHVDLLVLRQVHHLDHVLRSHDQGARRERVRGDERDHVALHAPGHHGAAVGQVVARRSCGSGDDEAVAANLAHLLSLDEVAELGHAAVGHPVEGDVVHGELLAGTRGGIEGRQGPDLEVAGQGPADALIEPVALDRRQEPDRPVVDREGGHVATCEQAQRGQDRPVAAEHEREVGVRARLGAVDHAVALAQPVLLHLLGRQQHPHARVHSHVDHPVEGLGGGVRPAAREDRDRSRGHGSALRAAASRSSTPPSRPASARWAKLSRLPAGPGSPDEA